MKSTLIIFLLVSAIISGFSVFSLQKGLQSARDNAAFYKKRSDDLQVELMRVRRARDEKERLLDEIEQSITELENKARLETLESYIPKKTWGEIKPVIGKLKALQGRNKAREK